MKLICHDENCPNPEQDEECFSWRLKKKGFRQPICRSCRSRNRKAPAFKAKRNEKIAEDKLINPDKYKQLNLKKKGVHHDIYDELFKKQNGTCAVCKTDKPGKSRFPGKDRSFALDHDHRCCPGTKTCGRCIRGLLCSNCNSAAGLLQDDPDIVWALSEYLVEAKYKIAVSDSDLRDLFEFHCGY